MIGVWLYYHESEGESFLRVPCGSREQTTGTQCHKMLKNDNILEFGDCIWIDREKCIQISTNMPSIGVVIPEIAFAISEISDH